MLDVLWSADRWLCILDDDIHAPRAGNGMRFWVSKWWTCPYYRPFAGRFWPTDYATITQRFGARPEYYKKFGLPGHEGMDVRAPEGTPVYAVDTGRVFVVYRNPLPKARGGHNYGIQHQGWS